MEAYILALSTAVPSFSYTQEEITNKIIEMLSVDEEKAQLIQKLHSNSAIDKRYAVLEDFKKERSEWNFWGLEFPEKVPGMSKRNDLYKIEAPKLACEAAQKVLKNWKGDPNTITHVIAVSCTGLIAPGIEFEIMQQLNLRLDVQRLSINFMGCFGAFKGLSVARAFAKENANHRILVVCVELSSLHFQVEQTPDNMLANSLFSDGAGAVVVGAKPRTEETPLWKICNMTSLIVDKTKEKMRWEVGDHGFVLKLSHTVPVLLKRHINSFVQSLLGLQDSYNDYNWAIHPGGKSIIQAIEQALKLERETTQASWSTLANYGNMSSATFLFVLHQLLEQKNSKKRTAGLAFGPGLSVEGILLERPG